MRFISIPCEGQGRPGGGLGFRGLEDKKNPRELSCQLQM